MTIQYYYIMEAEGRNKGPFLAGEILALTEQSLLAPGASIRNDRGEALTRNDLESAGGSPITAGMPSPPPLPAPCQEKESDDSLWFLTRRNWFAFAVLGVIRVWYHYHKKPPKRQPLLDRQPFGSRKEKTSE